LEKNKAFIGGLLYRDAAIGNTAGLHNKRPAYYYCILGGTVGGRIIHRPVTRVRIIKRIQGTLHRSRDGKVWRNANTTTTINSYS